MHDVMPPTKYELVRQRYLLQVVLGHLDLFDVFLAFGQLDVNLTSKLNEQTTMYSVRHEIN